MITPFQKVVLGKGIGYSPKKSKREICCLIFQFILAQCPAQNRYLLNNGHLLKVAEE